MDLASRLRELRGTLTQKELAAELHVSSAAISSWENQSTLPTLLRLQQYASRFGGQSETSRHELLTELIELRMIERSDTPAPENPLDEVMADIRWLLVEIRDRLPPRS
jgi:transcriptional regulator with XRE-family HTH domain